MPFSNILSLIAKFKKNEWWRKTQDSEELIENWTLIPSELQLAKKKVGGNQIGFALLLKYFQLMARFPDLSDEIPDNIISYIANQLNISVESYSYYNLFGRTAKIYRDECFLSKT